MSRSMVVSVFVTTFMVLALPTDARSQVCIGNSADHRKVSSATASTGGVALPHDLGLHMVGVKHVRGQGAFFGLGQGIYSAQYGALTGVPNGSDYNRWAYRGTGRWLFDLPAPAAVPDEVGVCFSVGMRLSSFGYVLKLQEVTEGAEISAWHFSWALPVTLDLGYRYDLNETFAVTPFLSPGIAPYWGGTLDETLTEEDDPLQTATDFFTRMGVALNHDMFRVGLLVESGLVEYAGGTRVGIEGGVRW